MTVPVDGVPTGLRCAPKVVVELCPFLTKLVSDWRFEPGQRDGVPAPMDISLDLDVALVPQGEGTATLRVLDSQVWLGSAAGDKPVDPQRMPPPQYPADAQRAGYSGFVELELWHDPGAKNYRVGRTWAEVRPAAGRKPLTVAAKRAAEQWAIGWHAPEQLSTCTFVSFFVSATYPAGSKPPPMPPDSMPAWVPRPGKGQCQPTYAEGFHPPKVRLGVTGAEAAAG